MIADGKRPRWKTVRVSVETYDRLQRLAEDFTRAFTEGRTESLVPSDLTDRVTLASVIDRAVDLFEDHRRRSNRAKK